MWDILLQFETFLIISFSLQQLKNLPNKLKFRKQQTGMKNSAGIMSLSGNTLEVIPGKTETVIVKLMKIRKALIEIVNGPTFFGICIKYHII